MTKQKSISQKYGFEELHVLRPIIKYMGVDRQYEGKTLMHIKIAANDLLGVQYLIENAADLNVQNNQGQTCLHIAIDSGHVDLVKFLLIKGADPNIEDKNEDTPLDRAYTYGDVKKDWRIFQIINDAISELNSKKGENTANILLYAHPDDANSFGEVAGKQAEKNSSWEDLV